MRDAEDFSTLPSMQTSAPGTTEPSQEDLPDLPYLAEAIGGQVLAASEAESKTPARFLALSPQARFACRLRAGGMRSGQIARLMRYAPGSVSNMLRSDLAKEYLLWLQEQMDDRLGTVQEGLQLLGLKALDRLTGIIHESENDNLVAKCSFQLLDRIGFKPAERVVIENNSAITSEDVARLKTRDSELNHVLKQSGES